MDLVLENLASLCTLGTSLGTIKVRTQPQCCGLQGILGSKQWAYEGAMPQKNTAHPSASEHFSLCHLVLTADGPQVSFCHLQMTPVHPHWFLFALVP